MRGRVITISALAALALSGCGSSDTSSDAMSGSSIDRKAELAKAEKAQAIAAQQAEAQTSAAAKAKAKAKALPVRGGRSAAVLLVHDDATRAEAQAEAAALSKGGVTTKLVGSGAAEARAALQDLQIDPKVDRFRLAIVGYGAGSKRAAQLLAGNTGVVAAALAGIAGDEAPWLDRVPNGTPVLLQHAATGSALTAAQTRQLVAAAPPGTLLHEYKALDAKARAAREEWLMRALAG